MDWYSTVDHDNGIFVMKDFIKQIDKYVKDRLVLSRHLGDLSIFNYSPQCTHERKWDEITLQCRGLILNMVTGEVVARPFPKFFNLNENESSTLDKMPLEEGYNVYEKCDGSLGILYRHEGKYKIATRGSFTSEQAIWATKYLNSNYDLSELPDNVTLLVEIIYPGNKIVVDYKGKKDLVLLAAYDRFNNDEYTRKEVELLALRYKFNICDCYDFTIDKCLTNRLIMPKDQEGYVIRFHDGTRVKIKGQEYLKIHRIIHNLTPKAVWEAMEDGKVSQKYLQEVPEEFLHMVESIKDSLENDYKRVYDKVTGLYNEIKHIEFQKDFAMVVLSTPRYKEYYSFLFAFKNGDQLDPLLMKNIRPVG